MKRQAATPMSGGSDRVDTLKQCVARGESFCRSPFYRFSFTVDLAACALRAFHDLAREQLG
jgi:hypothetical protein